MKIYSWLVDSYTFSPSLLLYSSFMISPHPCSQRSLTKVWPFQKGLNVLKPPLSLYSDTATKSCFSGILWGDQSIWKIHIRVLISEDRLTSYLHILAIISRCRVPSAKGVNLKWHIFVAGLWDSYVGWHLCLLMSRGLLHILLVCMPLSDRMDSAEPLWSFSPCLGVGIIEQQRQAMENY